MKYRKIHLNDQVWKYIITADSVILRSPSDKKTVVAITNFLSKLGWTEEEIMPCKDDYWEHFSISIGPQMIKDYIEKEVVNEVV